MDSEMLGPVEEVQEVQLVAWLRAEAALEPQIR